MEQIGKHSKCLVCNFSTNLSSNWVDNIGNTPLGYAVRTSSQCSHLLLRARANVHNRDAYRANLLCRIMGFVGDESESLQVVKSLVYKGINVNEPRLSGETALWLATEYGRIEIAKYLLEVGADPAASTESGANCLCQATQRNHHELIQLFLEKGQDHTQNLLFHGTFMHLAAEFADTESLWLLAYGSLRRRDVLVKNKDGLTPEQLARRSSDMDPKWLEAFVSFMKSIDQTQAPTDEFAVGVSSGDFLEYSASVSDSELDDQSEADDSNDEFFDAIEFQPTQQIISKYVDNLEDTDRLEATDIMIDTGKSGDRRKTASAVSTVLDSPPTQQARLRKKLVPRLQARPGH